jgi:endonuclease YncB( thermonuclease family)
MLRMRTTLVTVAIIMGLGGAGYGAREKVILKKFIDGDSFHAQVNGTSFQVRMIGADTPEAYARTEDNQKLHATAASDFLKSQIKIGDEIEIERNGDRKSYDRVLAWVYVKNQELGLQLVKNGLAIPYLYCDRYVCQDTRGTKRAYNAFFKKFQAKEYTEACHQAQKDQIGIWDAADTEKGALEDIPQEYRRRTLGKGEKTRYLIASISKKVYLDRGLADYSASTTGIDYCDRVLFESDQDAQNAGYKLTSAPVK